MQVNITGQNVDITEALRTFIDEKFERIERHVKSVTPAHVILHIEKTQQRAEATINVKGAQLFAESVGSDLYAAVDTLVDKLVRQAIKHKEKMNGE